MHRTRKVATGALLLTLVGCGRTNDAQQQQLSAGSLSVLSARIPESPGGERLAVYAEIRNEGPADALVGLRAEVSEVGSLHVMESADGMMTMRRTDALPVGEGETLILRTGGAHGMLERLHRVPMPGDTVDVTFVFASGTEVLVSVPVVSLADLVGAP